MTRKHALIVDDSSTAQYRLKMLLRPYDLDINAVDSGEAALRFLEVNAPDVIFMDHLMPGMDGFRALQIIKSHPETAAIPVIMYTSQGGDVYTGQARALGALDVVSKATISAADLSRVMRAIHVEPAVPVDPVAPATPLPSAALDPASARGTDPQPRLERRATHRAGSEQARALEMRLRQLELVQEDSQRATTARLVREIHTVRKELKKELADLATVLSRGAGSVKPAAPQSGALAARILAIVLVLGGLGAGLLGLYDKLDDLTLEQRVSRERVAAIAAAMPARDPAASPALHLAESTLAAKPAEEAYLQDLAWAFNQSGALAFNRDGVDRTAVLRVGELLGRLRNRGFRGTVEVGVSVGNFCTLAAGQALPAANGESARLGECVLSSASRGPERMMDQYTRELTGLRPLSGDGIQLLIRNLPPAEAYPEPVSTQAASAWNAIASRNHRIELRIHPGQPEKPGTANLQAVLAGSDR